MPDDARVGRERSPFPAFGTTFVGREQEIRRVLDALERVRFVTLTGIGGVGKTRIASEAAREMGEHMEVAFADMTNVGSADLVGSVIAEALDVEGIPGVPVLEMIVREVGDASVLLVVDNAETTTPELARIGPVLVRRCERLRILATSRTPLEAEGELVIPIQPMPTPSPGTEANDPVARTDAVRLFLDRAGEVGAQIDWTPETGRGITEIVRRVGGIPLGIELAASRLRSTSLEDLAAGLDEHALLAEETERGTLGELLRWSLDALRPETRELFLHLGAFAGAFTIDMPPALFAEPPEELALLDGLAELIDHGLLTTEIGPFARYTIPDTARRFARELLSAEDEEADVSRRHARLFAARAAEIDRAFGRADWLEQMSDVDDDLADRADAGDFRRALAWTVEHRDGDLALALAGGLGHYWKWRGRYEEAATWMRSALALPSEDARGRAKVLRELAGIERLAGRFEQAATLAREAADLFDELGDRAGLADALYDVGFSLLMAGEGEAAERTLWKCVSTWEALGEPHMVSFPLVVLAWNAKATGRYDEAERLWDRVLASPGSMAARSGIVFWRADLALDQGDVDRGVALAEEARAAAESAGFRHYAAAAGAVLARAALIAGEVDRASSLVTSAREAAPGAAVEIQGLIGTVATETAIATGELDLAGHILDGVATISRRVGSPNAMLATLDLGAELALASGDPGVAVTLMSASSVLRARHGLPLPVPEARRRETTVRRLRDRFEGFDEAWEEGGDLSLEAAVDLARPR